MRHARNVLARSLWVLAAASSTACPGVDSDDDDDDSDEPVVIVGGYPLGFDDLAAFAAADWYWLDETFSGVVFVPSDTPTRGPTDPAAAIRALAQGIDVCEGGVSVTPTQVTTPCGQGGTEATIRGGAVVVLDACELPGGTVLAGTFEITSVHTTEDPACDADTIVTVEYTATFTDFSWMEPSGTRVVIPQLQRTGRLEHRPGELPTMLSVATTGRIQRYVFGEDLDSDRAIAGDLELELETMTGAFVTSGVTTVEDLVDGGTLRWSSEDVRREPACCRPVSGTLVVSLDGVASETWDFGPTCGTASRDGEPDLLPGCP